MISTALTTKRLYFGIPVGTAGFWIAEDAWLKIQGEVREDEMAGRRLHLGLDLSQKNDLTALSGCWEGDTLAVKTWYWTTEDRLAERSTADQIPYRELEAAGLVSVTPGAVIDYEFVAAEVKRICTEHHVVQLVFDAAFIGQFIKACDSIGFDVWRYAGPDEPEGVGLKIVGHGQGPKVVFEGKQLCMPISIRHLEDHILKDTITIDRSRLTDNCLFHPLVGLSPIFACGLAAMQGYSISNSSTLFFGNRAMPSGILVAPGPISNQTAEALKASWEANYGGQNAGKIAVVGDGLKFEPMTMKSTDAQLIEQLRWSDEVVCRTFHVPPYKIGVGAMPSYNNIEALNIEYYSQALQKLIEDAEACLDEGLALDGVSMGTEFDLDGLLRIDSVTQITAIRDADGAGVMSPNEGRRKLDLMPAPGGDSPYLQEQNYSLEALAKRDAQADPWGSAQQEPDEEPELAGETAKAVFAA